MPNYWDLLKTSGYGRTGAVAISKLQRIPTLISGKKYFREKIDLDSVSGGDAAAEASCRNSLTRCGQWSIKTPAISGIRLRHQRMKSTLYIAAALAITVGIVLLSGPVDHRRSTALTPVTPAAQRAVGDVPAYPITPKFVDATLDAGLLHAHLQGDDKLTGLNETLGAGACAFDYDNDGWIDIFAVGGSGQTRFYGRHYWWQKPQRHSLYRNKGDGTFIDVTEPAGLVTSSWGMGCAAADLDNDGDSDLFITQFGKNALYRNNGNGTFSDVSTEAGLNQDVWSTSAVIADVDLDGLLDIYVVNYLRYVKGAHTFEAFGGFDLGMSPAFEAKLYDGVPNQLLKNEGGLRFRDVAVEAGVDDASGRGLHALFLDANNDRYPDLYVANDAGFPNQLFLNNRDGTFNNVSTDWKAGISSATYGVAASDVDHDGDLDVFLSSAAGELPKLLIHGSTPSWLRTHFESQHAYRDLARQLGIADERFVSNELWGSAFGDFNNDGHVDLLALAGLHTPDPTSYKVSQGQAKLLWLGKHGGAFVAVNNTAVPFADRLSGRGLAIADFDNDGDLDAYINNNNDLNQFLRNDTPSSGQWIGFRVLPASANRDAVGATVRLTTKDSTQFAVVGNRTSFLSQSDERVHFGLGTVDGVLAVTVQWPDGSSATFQNLEPNRYYILHPRNAPQASPPASPTNPTPRLRLALGPDDPNNRAAYVGLFSNAPARLSADEYHAALRDPNLEVRLAVINALTLPGDPETFRCLIAALANDMAEVRLAALEGLRQVENEYSSRWLLRMFDDPDPRVRRALAQMYAFFFREEEAMVHRKHLAVPYLIRMLDDSDQEVRLAAILALGEAENIRGVNPLIALLDDTNLAVRAEAARALGRIRERDAAPALIGVVQSSGQPPEVKAQALIALKRLSEPRLAEVMTELWADSAEPSVPLQTFLAIRQDTVDGIVFNPVSLATQAIDATASRALNKTNTLLLCQLLADLRDPRVLRMLGTLSKHKDTDIRAAAMMATERHQSNAQLAAADTSALQSFRTSLRQDLKPGAFLPTAPANVKAAMQHPDDEFKTAALELVSERREAWATDLLFDMAIADSLSVELRATAFRHLATRANVKVNNAMVVLLARKDDPARLAVVEAASLDDPRIKERMWAILRDGSETPAMRLAVAQRLMTIAPDETLAVVRGG